MRLITLITATILLSVASTARAGDFEKGTWMLSIYTGYDRECSSDPQMTYAAAGVGYYFADGLSLHAETRAYYVRQDQGEDAAMFELDVMFRHHIIRKENWSLFLEVGAGITQATRRVPLGGTHFNFVEEAGAGITCKLAENVHLITGVRYWHLSNARIHGEDTNPGLNGVGGYVGVTWKL